MGLCLHGDSGGRGEVRRWRGGSRLRRGRVQEGVNSNGGHVVGILVLYSAGGALITDGHCAELHSLWTARIMMSTPTLTTSIQADSRWASITTASLKLNTQSFPKPQERCVHSPSGTWWQHGASRIQRSTNGTAPTLAGRLDYRAHTTVPPWLQPSSAAHTNIGKNNLHYKKGGCFLVWVGSPITHTHTHFSCVKQLRL